MPHYAVPRKIGNGFIFSIKPFKPLLALGHRDIKPEELDSERNHVCLMPMSLPERTLMVDPEFTGQVKSW